MFSKINYYILSKFLFLSTKGGYPDNISYNNIPKLNKSIILNSQHFFSVKNLTIINNESNYKLRFVFQLKSCMCHRKSSKDEDLGRNGIYFWHTNPLS